MCFFLLKSFETFIQPPSTPTPLSSSITSISDRGSVSDKWGEKAQLAREQPQQGLGASTYKELERKIKIFSVQL